MEDPGKGTKQTLINPFQHSSAIDHLQLAVISCILIGLEPPLLLYI